MRVKERDKNSDGCHTTYHRGLRGVNALMMGTNIVASLHPCILRVFEREFIGGRDICAEGCKWGRGLRQEFLRHCATGRKRLNFVWP